MNVSTDYIIFNYTKDEDKKTPILVQNERDLFELVDAAHRLEQQIVIYRLGECLLDWS